MAIVTYKCDVCKREIGLQQNVHGLETPNRCIITHGCRGKLYFKELLPDYIRSKTPDDVIGLDNWRQRKVLFNYEQGVASDNWTIIHNLGNSVNVSVFAERQVDPNTTELEEIEPEDIITISSDIVQLKFDRPRAGVAQLVARASDPHLLRPTSPIIEDTSSLVQLSNLGELTVATKIPMTGAEPYIQLEISYNTPQQETRVEVYTIDDQPSILSAWSTLGTVLINSKLYTVRSFSGLISDDPISNGSTFTFTAIDDNNDTNFRDIDKNEVLLLLAHPPYDNIDKNSEQIIDVTDVTASNNPFAFAYDTGEFFASDNTVQSIYPYVQPATT